jgi:hypothetical protein
MFAFSLSLVVLFAVPAQLFADTNINQFFGQLEQQYQLPAGILAKVAQVESGGNPNAGSRNSSAVGLFQWLTNSWESASKALYGRPLDPSLRTSPVESAKVTAFALADAKAQLGPLISQTKIDMTVGLYLAHFLGVGGARAFLNAYIQNPGLSACSVLPKACASNGSVMNRSLSGVVNYFAQKLQQPGVINIAGNFQDGQGISYAYSSADLTSQNFLPANTKIGVDPQYDYPPTYTHVQQPQSVLSPGTQLSAAAPAQAASAPTVTAAQPILAQPTINPTLSALTPVTNPVTSAFSSTTVATSAVDLLEALAEPVSATSSAIGTAVPLTLDTGPNDIGMDQNGAQTVQTIVQVATSSYAGSDLANTATDQETFTSSDMSSGAYSNAPQEPQQRSFLLQLLSAIKTFLQGILNLL